MSQTIHRFSFPTNIVFGPGAVAETGPLAQVLDVRRALIVTDRGVLTAGLVDPVRRSLEAAGVATKVFDAVDPNPTEANVEAGSAAYRDHAADGVVAVGGGSALDAAKAVRLRAAAAHSLPLEDYDDNFGGEAKITADMPPMLALPTTAGTGSEVGRSAVITCRANGRKTVIFSPHLMPNYAICDPELTLGLPASVTAATGMDALTHNMEAYLAKPYHPMADGIALQGLRLCSRSLRRAVEAGGDIEARADMMMAAMMGATAFQKGLGVTHSLAHPLSSIAGMHHGTANAVLLPHVLEFNVEACPDRYVDIAGAVGLPGRPESVIAWVRALNAAVGIPAQLRAFGVTRAMVPAMVEKAMQDGCHLNNPRPCTADDMRALYEAAI